MIVTIHQPNFFPWWPFFEKIQQADVYVCLTHCQFEKNGYQNRFNFNNNWYTMSVKRGLEPILDKEYIDPKKNWNRIKNNLPKYKSVLNEFDTCIGKSLSATNFCMISNLCDMLNIKTGLEVDYHTHLTSTNRLVDICVQYGAKKYLSGVGGRNYLDESIFKKAGIDVIYQEIKKPVHVLEVL